MLEAVPLAHLKVSARSNPHAVAGAVAGEVREHGYAEAQVVGAGALNQAMKAVAIARGFFQEDGLDLLCVPSFTEIRIDGDQRTAMMLRVESRRLSEGAAGQAQRARDLPADGTTGQQDGTTAILNV